MDTNIDYYICPSALSKENCQRIINLGKEKIANGETSKAVTFGNTQKSETRKVPQNELTQSQIDEQKISKNDVYLRDSNISWIDEKWVYNLLWPYVEEANKKSGWNYDIDFAEPAQFTIYDKEQFYGWHSDGMNDKISVYRRKIPGVYDEETILSSTFTSLTNLIGKVRKISLTVNLTDPNEYEGGNLKFDLGPHKTNRFKEVEDSGKQKGSIVIFPSYKYHCVTPVTKGTRYSLVIWFNGRPMK
jgi:PKHD-type hydroxylase